MEMIEAGKWPVNHDKTAQYCQDQERTRPINDLCVCVSTLLSSILG